MKKVNLLLKIKEIFETFDIKPLNIPAEYSDVYQYLRDFPSLKNDFKAYLPDDELNIKYFKYVPRGCYGFNLGYPTNPIWNDVIDQILELLTHYDSTFEIHQIKIKFGGIKFLCFSDVIEDMFQIEEFIESKLFDEKLIY